MKITLNGAEREIRAGLTLAGLAQELDVDAATLVAEVDGVIVKAQAFAATELRPGMQVELVRFVGGG
jgi:thiamine biosynthesis protein ThiS